MSPKTLGVAVGLGALVATAARADPFPISWQLKDYLPRTDVVVSVDSYLNSVYFGAHAAPTDKKRLLQLAEHWRSKADEIASEYKQFMKLAPFGPRHHLPIPDDDTVARCISESAALIEKEATAAGTAKPQRADAQ